MFVQQQVGSDATSRLCWCSYTTDRPPCGAGRGCAGRIQAVVAADIIIATLGADFFEPKDLTSEG